MQTRGSRASVDYSLLFGDRPVPTGRFQEMVTGPSLIRQLAVDRKTVAAMIQPERRTGRPGARL